MIPTTGNASKSSHENFEFILIYNWWYILKCALATASSTHWAG